MYPITASQYQAFWSSPDGAEDRQWWFAGGWEKRQLPQVRHDEGNHPATSVSWYDAMAFTEWLSARLGYRVSLPTEIQWERVAREGGLLPVTSPNGVVEQNGYRAGLGQPCAVGLFPANPLGVADLVGNVWEWCASAYTDDEGRVFGYPYDPTDGRESLELEDCFRVVRGGSYTNVNFLLRCTVRGHDRPLFRPRRQGFRIVSEIVDHGTGAG
jgi:formylglycine-generating enzyme required for sulfatase activity